jgi:hypothetical protein
MAARQITQANISDACAHEAFHFVTNLEKHAANLAINALPQDHAQSRRRDGMQSRNLCLLTVEKNSAQ